MAMLLGGLNALAQAPPSEFDASIPDASVGIGGAEMSQEMEDGKSNTVCSQARDCEHGFTCNKGKCTYVGYRMASQPSCLGASAIAVFPLMVLWGWRRHRQSVD